MNDREKEKYSVVTSEYSISIIKKPKKMANAYLSYLHNYEVTKNYFSLLEKGMNLKDALTIYVEDMKKVYNEEDIDYNIILFL